jgi:ribonuclease VapC
MIATDKSALMAVVLGEPDANRCIDVLHAADEIVISAGTIAEALIVSGRRGVQDEMEALIEGLPFKIVNVTEASARRMAQAYSRWGRGVHPAGINLGDCFAYEVAKQHSCPLLFIGSDFSKTDIEPVLKG